MPAELTGVKDAAPIAIFAYRRAEHLRRTIKAISRCELFDSSPVMLFADGARSSADKSDVLAVRSVATELLGERAELNFSEPNLGLARSVIAGVQNVVDRFGRVIVLEDDLSVSPYFLRFMNDALNRYAECTNVYQVSGHMFNVPVLAGRGEAVFLPFTTSWGWATWRRAWDQFDPRAQGWERLAREGHLRKEFNLGGVYDYAGMLERQMQGLGDSWAVRWNWSVFVNRGLTLFPTDSLVSNTGMDGTGTHGRGRLRRFRHAPVELWARPVTLPTIVVEDVAAFSSVRKAIWIENGGVVGHLADRTKSYLRGIGRR